MGSPRRPAPPPPPPPPPGPPPPALPSPGTDVRDPGGRLRALHWEPVPVARVRARRSVWAPRAPPPPIDLPRLRLLFRDPRGAASPPRPAPAASLLDPKRSLALGVFLKQVKRPPRQIVRDIQEGVGTPYGAERLRELSRLLPGAAEAARLRAFPGSPRQLGDPELFALLLAEVPSCARRLELLVLREEFSPRLSALRGSIQTLTAAATELLECEELHAVLHLILSAGNHLNAGGYAGRAAGFRLASLPKLSDTKATEPGVDLLHFVAMEAARLQETLLGFPGKLRHVGPAARLDVSEVDAELRRLAGRLEAARSAGAEELQAQLRPFLRAAEEELRGARDAAQRMHRAAAAALDFFCEDTKPAGLPQLCTLLHGFAGRFLAAAQENRAREQAQHQRQQRERLQRRSIATCSARDAAPRHAAIDARFPLTPQPGRRGLVSPRPGLADDPAGGGTPCPPAAPPVAVLPEAGGPAPALPPPPAPADTAAPASPRHFSGLVALFQRQGVPRGTASPPPPPANPPGGSALLGFLRRLAGGTGRAAPPS